MSENHSSKRFIDFFLSIILILLSLPLLIIFSLVLSIELKSFPFFIQDRGLTLDKFRFRIFKLRTLKKIHTDKSYEIDRKDIFLKPALAGKVTRFAAWLRRTGLDEMPQFFNILMGQMSFIGPRPLMLSDLNTMKNDFPEYYYQRQRFNTKPGLSGIWQLFGNRDLGIENLIGLEHIYEQNRSPVFDTKLMMLTVPLVIMAKNSDAILVSRKPRKSVLPSSMVPSLNLKVANLSDSWKFSMNLMKEKNREYIVELPENWWYVSNTLKTFHKKSTVEIFDIDSKKNEVDKQKSA